MLGDARRQENLEHPLIQVGKKLWGSSAMRPRYSFLALGLSEFNSSRPCPSKDRRPSKSITPTAMSGACNRANCFTCSATDSGM